MAAAARAASGSEQYTIGAAARVVEALADVIDAPDLQNLSDSAGQVLRASDDLELADPTRVVHAIRDAGGDPSNGVDEAEARAAAASSDALLVRPERVRTHKGTSRHALAEKPVPGTPSTEMSGPEGAGPG